MAQETKPVRTGSVMPGRGAIYGGKPKNAKATLKQMSRFLGKNKVLLGIVLFVTILSTLCMLAGTYAIRPLISEIQKTLSNQISVSAFFNYLVYFMLILGSIYLTQIISTLIQTQLMVKVSQVSVFHLRKELYSHVLNLPLPYHDSKTHGELMSRFTNDIDLIAEAITNSMASIVNSSLMLVGTVIMMFILSIPLAFITLMILPIFSFLINRIINQSRKYFRLQQASIGALNGFIEETMEGQQVNQLFNHQERNMHDFSQYNADFKDKAFHAQSWSGIMIPVMMNLNALNYAIISTGGAMLCISGALSVGALGAYLNATRQFARPLNEIAMQYTTIQAGLASAERIFEVLNEPIEVDNENAIESEIIDGEVRFDDVHFSYVKDVEVLKGISFYAKKGQKIAFVGSTGAGKTTITNLISRFYDIQEGSITLDNISISSLKRSVLRQSMAMVLQDTHLFTGTVMENIRYGKLDATDQQCIEAAQLANAHSFIIKLPLQYQTIITSDGSELSAGQRQLLNIARAAVNNPKVLILDEATSSIDTRTERSIEKGMDQLMEGRTTFVIAHRLSTVRHSNAILVIEKGEIIERGDHDTLMEINGRYASLVKGQTELT